MSGSHIPIPLSRLRITRTSVLLVLTAMLVLMMPVNYRAGTEIDHPHAFFQTMIDHVTGRPHHHGGDGHDHAALVPASSRAARLSPFAPPSIPLNALEALAPAPLPPPADLDPDVPTVTSVKPTLDHPLVLTSLVAFALAAMVVIRRYAWRLVRLPGARAIAPEPPPPRLFSLVALSC